eukprot:gene15001-20180_t
MENQPFSSPQTSFQSMTAFPMSSNNTNASQPSTQIAANHAENIIINNAAGIKSTTQTVHSLSDDEAFVCSVCLDSVKNKDPVVTQCGHLYCWSCLYRWLNTNHTTCPVCKAGVTQDNVIPIFIRGSSTEDPRKTSKTTVNDVNIPNRPLGRRPEPIAINNNANQTNNGTNTAMGGITLSTGFGFFPSLFGLQFQSFTPNAVAEGGDGNVAEEVDRVYLSRVLYVLGATVVLCLLFF